MMYSTENFIEELKRELGDNLVSVVVYGSAALEAHTKKSGMNVLLVVKDPGFVTLTKLAPITQRWQKTNNPPPLVMAQPTIKNAQDVFAIEFADIQAAHKNLYGPDLFSGIQTDDRSLRQQLEFELRSKVLILRQQYLRAAGNNLELQRLMTETYPGLTTLARTILRLIKKPVPSQKNAIWRELANHCPINISVADLVHEMRQGDKMALKEDPTKLFESYLDLADKMVEFVDQFIVRT